MPDPRLEEVFKTSGVPTHTFVEPKEYAKLLVNLRTPGRGLVIEGPSGIGKTTGVVSAIQGLGLERQVTRLSARRPDDVEYIRALPSISGAGVVIVDDFHKLPDSVRAALADYLKMLADEEREGDKLVVVGINRAGDNLINFAHDLVNRVDVLKFETNPDHKIRELVEKGEQALNISINVREDLVELSQGSFYIAQMLCHEICIHEGVLEASDKHREVNVSLESIQSAVYDRLARAFRPRCERFCRGTKFRREGRAPYLHILRWLAQSDDWTLSLRDAIRTHSELRGSIGQVVEKGFLRNLIEGDGELQAVLHFDADSDQLTVEDPQFLFYIRQIPWRHFAQEVGFSAVEFESRYDFALSFAGSDRDIAESLASALQDREIEVFYDYNEQHRILTEDVEEYLRPIYQSEARYVVVLLGPDYPRRIWTKMESDAFRDRIKGGDVVPVWFSNAQPGMFDETRKVGGVEIDRNKPIEPQVENLANTLSRMLMEAARR